MSQISNHSYGVAKVIIENVLPNVFNNPQKAATYFHPTAQFGWKNITEKLNQTVKGRLFIYRFLKRTLIPLEKINILSYTAQTTKWNAQVGELSIISVSGVLVGPTYNYKFNASFHILHNPQNSQQSIEQPDFFAEYAAFTACIIASTFIVRKL